MQYLKSLETSILVDMLVKLTTEYSSMFNEGSMDKQEFELCKLTIKAVQKEIESRKEATATTNNTDPDFILQAEN